MTVSSPLAMAAKETASCLLECCGRPNYTRKFSTFAIELIKQLNTCFVKRRSRKTEREIMWGGFHQLRSSATFKDLWVIFVQEVTGTTPSPIFYQHVTQHVFELLVKQKFLLLESAKAVGDSIPHLTRVEENTLRYVSGYVCRKVKKQLESSTHKSKDSMILCLTDLYGDEDEERGTEDWTNSLDRGGLWHVNDTAYSLFYAMEEEVRSHLMPKSASSMGEGNREVIVSAVLSSEDVLFQWSMLSVDADDADGKELLQMIVKHYVTIRGFSFANTCVELFKRDNNKILQKGKGLRKELFTSAVSTN